MYRRNSIELLIITLLFLNTFAWAGVASIEGAYQRKSISYVNTLWLATPNAQKISTHQAAKLLDIIRKQVEFSRFDSNPLPENLFKSFSQKAKKRGNLTIPQAADLMNEIVIPIVLDVLNEQMTIRAKGLLGEVERNTFITTKAKDLGLTVEHFNMVLNSSYIYLPILTDFNRSVTQGKVKQDGKVVTRSFVNYKIKGGIAWFSLEVLNGRGNVNLVKIIEEKGWSADTDDSTAFTCASILLAANLRTRTLEIPDFRLCGQILECFGRRIGFNLGKKEGVFIDQKYLVHEYIQDAQGDRKLKNKGFLMVRRTGDNTTDRNVLSYGKPVIGTPDSGMLLEEFPRLSTDFVFRIFRYNARIHPGETDTNPFLSVEKEANIVFPMANIALQKNIARLTRVPQLFVTLGGNLGFLPTSGLDILFDTVPYPTAVSSGLCWNLYTGMMKKFYSGRLAFVIEPRYEYQVLRLQKRIRVEDKSMNVSYTNLSHLMSMTLGLEIALKANLNLGMMVGLKGLFNGSSQNMWQRRYSYTEGEGETQTKHEGSLIFPNFGLEGPEVEYRNPHFGIYINYSPASFGNIIKVVTHKDEESGKRITILNFLGIYQLRLQDSEKD